MLRGSTEGNVKGLLAGGPVTGSGEDLQRPGEVEGIEAIVEGEEDTDNLRRRAVVL